MIVERYLQLPTGNDNRVHVCLNYTEIDINLYIYLPTPK